MGNSDFFFSLRNFSFREFCVFSLKILPFVRFLNFLGISDLFENEDFDSKFCSLLKFRLFLSTLTFSWNSDLFGRTMTYLGILTLLEYFFFSVKILLQLDFLYILTFSGNSHLSPLVNSDFSGKSNLFENSDCWNFDFFLKIRTYREFSLF